MLTAIVREDVGEEDVRDPPVGRYFYKLEVDPAEGQSGPYPVELVVKVSGKVIESSKPASDPEPAGSSDADDDGPSDIVLLAGGVGGIAVGLVAGGALAGTRRRRPA